MEDKFFILNGYKIPKLLIGTNHMNYAKLKDIVNASLEEEMFGFDTSPNYYSEENLGQIIKDLSLDRTKIFIQDKIDNQPLIMSKGNISELVKDSIKKLNVDYIDSLLLHWPTPDYFEKAYLQMEKMMTDGLVRFIGVSNFRVRHLNHLLNSQLKMTPVFNQIEVHPLRTVKSQIEYHNEHDIITQAYAPLCRMKDELSNSSIIKETSEKYSKTKAQIILRWHVQNGIIPVFKGTL